MRPRFNKAELELINYCLGIVEAQANVKLKEQEGMSHDLKTLAKYTWFTGDRKALAIFKPYKQYMFVTLQFDYFQLATGCRLLKRRLEGVLDGRRFRRCFLEPLTVKKPQ